MVCQPRFGVNFYSSYTGLTSRICSNKARVVVYWPEIGNHRRQHHLELQRELTITKPRTTPSILGDRSKTSVHKGSQLWLTVIQTHPDVITRGHNTTAPRLIAVHFATPRDSI